MGKYVVAVVVGCLYAACSVWLVRSEGQAYRDALHGAGVAAEAAPRPEPADRRPGETETASTRRQAPTPDPTPPNSVSEPTSSGTEPSKEEPSPAPKVADRKKAARKDRPRDTATADSLAEATPRPTEPA